MSIVLSVQIMLMQR